MNKIISDNDLRVAMRKVLPAIQFIWTQSTTYIVPTTAELEAALVESKVHDIRFDGELADCDYYSLQLNARLKAARAALSDQLPMDERYPWAFGECSGNLINRLEVQHTLNICLTQEGLVLVEPQTYDIWTPTPATDSIQIAKV
jgi:hypothetical protein